VLRAAFRGTDTGGPKPSTHPCSGLETSSLTASSPPRPAQASSRPQLPERHRKALHIDTGAHWRRVLPRGTARATTSPGARAAALPGRTAGHRLTGRSGSR
jgi:hypothetical protein